MKTKLVLKLGDGNFQQGFPNSAIEVRPNGGGGQMWNCHLPPGPDLPQTYQKWQGQYRGLAQNTQTFRAGKKKTYPAKVSIAICEKCYQELGAKINDWLNALPIIGELKEILNSQESADNQTILLEVDTQRVTDPQTKHLLHQLHLELWDLFNSYQVENCLRLHEVKSDTQEIAGETRNKRVNVLGIFGDDTDINLGEDVKLINRLRSQRAHPVFLPDANGKELTRADFEALWDYRWDVVIFAGHSKTILGGKTGVIELNKNESLDFQEIKETLKEAKKLGLKLAILNSCDGLGLAEQLKGLGITVIVWREPVPDNIASQWLKYFLKEFTNTDKPDGSIYRAMWAAQQRLGEVKPKSEEDVRQKSKKERAGLTGLPIVIHNGSEEPPTWNQLRGRSGGRIGGADENRKKFLEDVKEKVQMQLFGSLYWQAEALTNLDKELQPEQINWLSDVDVKTSSYERRLPPYTDIYEIFDEWVGRKLLILGKPGSGKTTTMLELARELVKDAEEDSSQPMPGLFNLSTWKNDKQSMVDWLVEQLKTKGVREDIARQWLKNKEILPILDGLDELESGRQESCVEAINRWLQSEYSPPGLVVCCRIEEYEKYETRLLLNGAVCLLPLRSEQIRDYLALHHRSDLWKIIKSDEKLLEMVQQPLFLSLVMVPKFSITDWQELDSFEERLEYLLNAYIDHRLLEKDINRTHFSKKKEPSPEKTKLWLTWLAQQMEMESQTEFLIEKMQPSWLENRQQEERFFVKLLLFALAYLSVGFPIPCSLLFVVAFFYFLNNGMLAQKRLYHLILALILQPTIVLIALVVFLTQWFWLAFIVGAISLLAAVIQIKENIIALDDIIEVIAATPQIIYYIFLGVLMWLLLMLLIAVFWMFLPKKTTEFRETEIIGKIKELNWTYLVDAALKQISFNLEQISTAETIKFSWEKYITRLPKNIVVGVLILNWGMIIMGLVFIHVLFSLLLLLLLLPIYYIAQKFIDLTTIDEFLELVFSEVSVFFSKQVIKNIALTVVFILPLFFSPLFLVLGMVVGCIMGIFSGLVGEEIATKKQPNQGTLASLSNAWYLLKRILFILRILSPFALLFIGFGFGMEGIGIIYLLALAFSMSAFWYFGLPSIQHFSLRTTLYCTGKTPRNYARFLDYATERMLLQRVGGGYRFLHKYLQEHFAHNLPK